MAMKLEVGMNEFLAIVAVLSVFLYWVMCRHDSYKIQKELADNVKKIINDDQVDFKIKRMAYFSYSIATKWWSPIAYMFLFILIVPIILFSKEITVSNNDENLDKLGGKSGSADLINSVMSQCAEYSTKRNPLIFTVITVIGFILVGMALLFKSALSWLSSILFHNTKAVIMPTAIDDIRCRIQNLLAYALANVTFLSSRR